MNPNNEDQKQEAYELASPDGCTRILNSVGADWTHLDGQNSYRRTLLTGELVYYGGPVVTARKSTGSKAPRCLHKIKHKIPKI